MGEPGRSMGLTTTCSVGVVLDTASTLFQLTVTVATDSCAARMLRWRMGTTAPAAKMAIAILF